MFAVVDADGSGAIQLDEFTDWYQAMVAKASNTVIDRPTTLLDSLLDWSSSSSSSSSASSQQDTDERLHTLESLSSRSKRRDT
jgi:Ca2+-binding EF-hand superfamily protein